MPKFLSLRTIHNDSGLSRKSQFLLNTHYWLRKPNSNASKVNPSIKQTIGTKNMRDFSPRKLDFEGMTIFVTGATGSFGQSFVKRILEKHNPKKVIIYSRDELKQYEMQQKIPAEHANQVRFMIGDVRDRDRLILAMRETDIVIHAAALKQVPAAEYNPMECVRTNIDGAENVVRCALDSKVQKVIALSTDKAANPINLYGATKLASDKIFIAANNLAGSIGTKFSVVRYGNVVGSRGSVVPYFVKLKKENAPFIPITDPRMTRFWITIDQGVDFVLSSLELMQGGEVFVPRIPSMSMIDLAEALAPGIPIQNIGIRPGEKLHEVMITEDDSRMTYELDDRYVILPSFAYWGKKHEIPNKAHMVKEGFRYASDNNSEWLDKKGLFEMLTASGYSL